ncbi:MAG: class I SAM-dependent methyltransferase, partial [Rubrobacteraceae bacterium]
MNNEAVKEFFNAWSIYDRVLDLNYMFHNEIYRDVASLIKKRYAARPFSILDLGCGSARHFAPALQGCTVSY